MESQPQTQKPNHHHHHQKSNPNMKKSWSLTSDDSPLRFHSPIRSDAFDPPDSPPYQSPENSPEKPVDNSKAIMAVDKFNQYPPLRHQKPPENAKALSPVVVYNRSVKEEVAPPLVFKEELAGVNGVGGGEEGGVNGGRSKGVTNSILRRSKRGEMMKTAALGFRVSELVLCLISFSVMAADKTQGWSGDSFDRYKEYRYCLAVNVIGFVYAAFQAYNLSYHLVTGKFVIRHHLRHHFDFFMDQVLAYLLISASSSAATRVDDWQSNWGKDEFTEMATASVSMAFLAFVAFALSSLISGYNLCIHDSA
ncbi:CASP-like protein 4A3 [Pyrus communis]|uniref:CASP-like protein 4A3 n=1 Tax=Pyrus communis TaxID=23211 RepID=UPI0035C0121D